MSIKIYNGFRIDLETSTVANLSSALYPLTELLKKTARHLIAQKFAAIATESYDRVSIGLKPSELHYLFEDYMTAAEWTRKIIYDGYREIYSTCHRNPSVDFQCSIHFYPLQSKILAIVQTEQEEYLDTIKAFPNLFHEYAYWSGGAPKHVEYHHWHQREYDWEVAFNRRPASVENFSMYGTSHVTPFTWNLFDPFDHLPHLEPVEINIQIPTLEKRIEALTWDVSLDAKVKSMNVPEAKRKDDFSSIMGAIREAEKFLKSESGKKNLNENAKSVKLFLKPQLDYTNFQEKIQAKGECVFQAY